MQEAESYLLKGYSHPFMVSSKEKHAEQLLVYICLLYNRTSVRIPLTTLKVKPLTLKHQVLTSFVSLSRVRHKIPINTQMREPKFKHKSKILPESGSYVLEHFHFKRLTACKLVTIKKADLL